MGLKTLDAFVQWSFRLIRGSRLRVFGHVIIPSRTTSESLVRRFDHHVTEEDLESAHVPPGSGGAKIPDVKMQDM